MSSFDDPEYWPHLRLGLNVQRKVLHSLIIRDLMMRYGRQNIGFLWVVLEPMILTMLVLVLWSYLHEAHEHGMTLIGFVFTGYMPITLYRHLTNCGVRMFRANYNLLFHPGVGLLDVYISRTVLEFVGTSIAFCVIYVCLLTFSLLEPMASPGLVMFGWVSYAMLSASVGFLIAILTDYWEPSERLIAPAQYILFPLSGTFFLVDWLPTSVQKIALFSPQIHCNEMIRAGMFGDTIITFYSLYYPMIFALCLFAFCLFWLERVRDSLKLV